MDLALDANGDLLVERGDLALVDGLDAIAQHVAIRLQFFQGEWFLDQRVGIPYFQQVLVKAPNLTAVRSLLRDAVTTTPGVIAIVKFDLELGVDRTLRVDFDASTDEGPLSFDRELILV